MSFNEKFTWLGVIGSILSLLFFISFLSFRLLHGDEGIVHSDIRILIGVCLIAPLAIFIGGSVIFTMRDPESAAEGLDERDRMVALRSLDVSNNVSGLGIAGLLGASIIYAPSAEFLLIFLTGIMVIGGLIDGVVRLRYYRQGV